MEKGAELIVRPASGRVREVAINLVGLDPKDIFGRSVVADLALPVAWVMPRLDASGPVGSGNDNVLVQTRRRQQIRVTVVRPPFVGHSVNFAGAVANQETRL